jgi:hypothetical protein
MKIIDLKSEQQDNLFKVGATVVWEDRDRAPQEVYIATTQEFVQDLYGLFIYGFSQTTLENYEKAYKSFDEIKKDAGITLIPVYTNLFQNSQT